MRTSCPAAASVSWAARVIAPLKLRSSGCAWTMKTRMRCSRRTATTMSSNGRLAAQQQPAHPLLAERVDREGERDEAQVEQQAPAFDVAAIEEERLPRAPAADDLGKPGQARRHAPAEIIRRIRPAEALGIGRGERTRPHCAQF